MTSVRWPSVFKAEKSLEDLNVLFRGVLEGNRKIKELPKSLQDFAKEIRTGLDRSQRINPTL